MIQYIVFSSKYKLFSSTKKFSEKQLQVSILKGRVRSDSSAILTAALTIRTATCLKTYMSVFFKYSNRKPKLLKWEKSL